MALVIARGQAASAGETWTPTKQNNSTLPTITVATQTMVGRTTAGPGSIEELSPAQARSVMGLGSLSLQEADNVNITGGGAILGIAQVNRLTQVMETGYATSGAIAIPMDSYSNAHIGLAGNSTFTTTGQQPGYHKTLALKNTTGGAITLGWSGMTACKGVTLPASLNAGEVVVIRLYAVGTNAADVFASYN